MTKEKFPFGAYNYCDYRCEKCPVTGDCPVFLEESKEENRGKDWIEIVRENLEKTLDMVKDFMEEHNIRVTEEDIKREELLSQPEMGSKISCLCMDYLHQVDEFIKQYNPVFFKMNGLWEEYEDLNWYKTVIPVKIKRALDSLHEFICDEDEFSFMDAFFTSLVVNKALKLSETAIARMKSRVDDARASLGQMESLLNDIQREFYREFPLDIFTKLYRTYHNQDLQTNKSSAYK